MVPHHSNVIVVHHFLPTSLSGWGAVIAALTAPIAAIASVLNRGKIAIVHDLVNGRLTQAIQALDDRHVEDRITERDNADAEK